VPLPLPNLLLIFGNKQADPDQKLLKVFKNLEERGEVAEFPSLLCAPVTVLPDSWFDGAGFLPYPHTNYVPLFYENKIFAIYSLSFFFHCPCFYQVVLDLNMRTKPTSYVDPRITAANIIKTGLGIPESCNGSHVCWIQMDDCGW
jgi:hypothetical protein